MTGTGKTAVKGSRTATRTAMVAITFVVCVLVVFLLALGSKLNAKIASNEQRAAELEQAIEAEEARVEEIRDLEKSMQSDEYIEEVAKDKLGMVSDGEILFKESK